MTESRTQRQITVGIGQYSYMSADGGGNWERRLREIPGNNSPTVRGNVDLSRLFRLSKTFVWDFVTVLPSGFGIAAGRAPDCGERQHEDQMRALAYATDDAGASWHELDVWSQSFVRQIVTYFS